MTDERMAEAVKLRDDLLDECEAVFAKIAATNCSHGCVSLDQCGRCVAEGYSLGKLKRFRVVLAALLTEVPDAQK